MQGVAIVKELLAVQAAIHLGTYALGRDGQHSKGHSVGQCQQCNGAPRQHTSDLVKKDAILTCVIAS